MNNLQLISVWIITYNQEKYIAKALESALEQETDFKYEIVIGEDCSTDGTRKILLEYQAKYPEKIKLLLHEKNVGMIANQNLTFKACQGEYIAMLEGDDFWSDKHKLQRQYDAMQKYPECALSFHPVYTTDGRVLNKYSDKIKVFTTEESIKGGGYFSSTPSLMIKKSVISSMPSFLDKAPAGDYYIQIFGSLNGGALFIPDIMATYRVNAEGSWSESVYDVEKKTNFIERTLRKIKKVDHYLNEKYTEAFQHRYQMIAITLAVTYLSDGQLEKFNQTIERTAEYVSYKVFRFFIVYHLRNFPSIVLYLSKDQFTSIEKLPKNLRDLIPYGLNIVFVEGDIRSYKKYIYNKDCFDDIGFIIVDDDIVYHPDTIGLLLSTSKRYPKGVFANRCILMDSNKKYKDWQLATKSGVGYYMATGCGGVYYPPGSLHDIAYDKACAWDNSPDGDDIWLKAATVLAGSPVVYTGYSSLLLPVFNKNAFDLHTENVQGERNDFNLKRVNNFMIHKYGKGLFDEL